MRLPSRVRLGCVGVLFANGRGKIPGFGGIGGMARLLDNISRVTIVTLHYTISKKCAEKHVCMSKIIGGGLTM